MGRESFECHQGIDDARGFGEFPLIAAGAADVTPIIAVSDEAADARIKQGGYDDIPPGLQIQRVATAML